MEREWAGDTAIILGTVAILIPVLGALLGLIYRSLRGEIARLERSLRSVVTSDVCIERHNRVLEKIRALIAPLDTKLDHVCGNGVLSDLKTRLQIVEQEVAVLKAQAKKAT